MAGIKVQIQGDASGLNSALNSASSSLNKFDRASSSVASNTNKLTKSVGNANGVAMEFNRIIQDAPFGMMGIGNNIQQLTANFGQLKNQTGSTGAALKATFASILTSGNLLALGVAAVTSAWTFYTMSQQKANKATKESTDLMTELTEKLSVNSKV